MIITPEAEGDLIEARAYFEGRGMGLGIDFLRSVEQTFATMERFPEAKPILSRGVRRALTRRFQFAVYYRLEEGEIVVLAVIHSRRDPQNWMSRS